MAKDSKVLVRIIGKDEGVTSVADKLGGTFSKLGKLALGAAGIYGIGAVTDGVKDLLKEGAGLIQIENGFNAIAAASGVNGQAILNAMQQATAGTVTAKDAMQSYNLASQLISDEFANNLPAAMQPLLKVSTATGDSMGYLMDSLVRGVGRLSPMILDNLGIQVDLNQAYQDYADANGLVVGNMTKTEQQMALMSQVTEKLQENTANLPDMADDATLAFAQWETTLADTKATLGAGLIPLFLPLLQGLQEVGGWVTTLGKYFRIVGEDGDYLNDYLSNLPDWLQGIVEPIGQVIGGIQEFGGIGEYIRSLNLSETFQGILPPGFATHFNNMRDAVMRVVDAFMVHWPAIQQAAMVVAEYFVTQLWPAIQNVLKALMEYVTVVLNGIADFWNKWGGDIVNIAKGVFMFLIDIVKGALNLIASIIKAITAIFRGDFDAAWAYIKSGVIAFGGQIWTAIVNFGERTKDSWKKIWENVKAKVKEIFAPVVDWFTEKFNKIKEGIQGVKDKIGEFIDKIRELAGKLLDLVLPDWLTPGSPTPLENAFSNLIRLGGEMSRVNPFDQFATTGNPLAPATGGGFGGGTQNVTININGADDPTTVAQAVARELRLQGVFI